MALTDDDIDQIYAIINEALEANDLKEQARRSTRVSDQNALLMEYQSKREQIYRKANGKRPRDDLIRGVG